MFVSRPKSSVSSGTRETQEHSTIEQTTKTLKELSKIEKILTLHSDEAIVIQFSIYLEGETFQQRFHSVRERMNLFYSDMDDNKSNSLHDVFTKYNSNYSFYEYEGEIIDLLKKRFGIAYRNENHTQKIIKLNKFIKKHMHRLSGKELRRSLAKIDENMVIEKDGSKNQKRFEVTFSSCKIILDAVDECLFNILQLSQTLKYIQCVLLEITQEIYQKLNMAFRTSVMPWMIFLAITARLYCLTMENINLINHVYNEMSAWSQCLPTREQIAAYLMKEVSMIFVNASNRIHDFASPFPKSIEEYTSTDENRYQDLKQYLLGECMSQENQQLILTTLAEDKVKEKLNSVSQISSPPTSHHAPPHKQKKKKK
ncbi:hypothetical protein FDP41_007687 [Naegleria fowleri]|uniref:Uncharacterized protein n=1 Tax=Naegleria fowleri TaxID=5763 RepID=A0A6A5C9W8_NAEFO|nr:uncharacterized protein FDP41_007687 [Naegleria fowleri]KAF0983772.1 hypothetical protein FDP41_007687 [Naegleria fowleri]CAG4710748.1 unnamed protein product [Naegleria fowleri]